MSQKRNTHTQKVLKGLSKKAAGASKASIGADNLNSLRKQYDVIKGDVIKLRKDLQKGYDMARSTVEKKSLLSGLLKNR